MRPTLQTFAVLSLTTATTALWLGVLAACTPPPSLYFATSPGHLRSAVPADTVVTIDFADAFHPSLPLVVEDFAIVGAEGTVPARYELDRDGKLSIHPDRPLEPGVYEVSGTFTPDATGHYQPSVFEVRMLASTTFTVGSRPRLLGFAPDTADLTLVFSEPVQADTVQVDVDGTRIVGTQGADAHLVQLSHPSFVELQPAQFQPETLHGEVLAVSGEPVDIQGTFFRLSPCTMTRVGGGSCSE